jgi:hypothetical protein
MMDNNFALIWFALIFWACIALVVFFDELVLIIKKIANNEWCQWLMPLTLLSVLAMMHEPLTDNILLIIQSGLAGFIAVVLNYLPAWFIIKIFLVSMLLFSLSLVLSGLCYVCLLKVEYEQRTLFVKRCYFFCWVSLAVVFVC